MKRNLMPLLGVAFVAAVVATGIFYGLLIPRLQGTASADDAHGVLVAARALDRGTVLRAEDLTVARMDGGQIPAHSLRVADQAVGLTLLQPMSANQPLTQPLVGGKGSAAGPSLAIPNGKRAVSVHPADSSGVVAMVRSGSRIDIQVLDTHGNQSLRRMLEDVEVLSVLGTDNNQRPVVTLLVGPDDADRLSLADATMQIRLVLRNPNDRSAQGPKLLSARP